MIDILDSERFLDKIGPEKGTYILVSYLEKPESIRIGKLGTFFFPRGHYAYVGSAFGPGGLAGRIGHHLAPIKKPHWHLDYFGKFTRVNRLWYSCGKEKLEHFWARQLEQLKTSSIPAARFGCSDCRCKSHLFHFRLEPRLDQMNLIETIDPA